MEKIRKFQDLAIWQKGITLVKGIYRITDTFPKHEIYCLRSQMRRSAISVPSNVAEGFRRRHAKEFKHFLNITMGSLAELETQIIISNQLKYINEKQKDIVLEKIDHLCRMVFNLHKKIN